MSALEKVALIIHCKYVGLTNILDNAATKINGLTFAFSWVTGPMEKRRTAARVGLEGSSPASMYELKWDNVLGITPSALDQ